MGVLSTRNGPISTVPVAAMIDLFIFFSFPIRRRLRLRAQNHQATPFQQPWVSVRIANTGHTRCKSVKER